MTALDEKMKTLDQMTNRKSIFVIQTLLTLFVVLVMIVLRVLSTTEGDWVKVCMAPFGAFALLFFLLFLFNRVVEAFNADQPYPPGVVLLSLLLLVGLAGLLVWGNIHLVTLTNTMERIVFFYAMYLALVLFLYFRLRNVWSMAVLTGLSEALILLLVFYT